MSIRKHVYATTSMVVLAMAPIGAWAQTTGQSSDPSASVTDGTTGTAAEAVQNDTGAAGTTGSDADGSNAATNSDNRTNATADATQGAASTTNDPATNPQDNVQAGQSDVTQTFDDDGYGDVYEEDRALAERTLMLDLDVFAQQIYERAYRRGYMAGAANMRDRFDRRMRQLSRQQDREGRNRRGDERSRSGMGANRDGGSIIVLPPGVSPEAFIERLQSDDSRNRNRNRDGN